MPSKIVVVGVGALGSHVVVFGRNLPVLFSTVDFDRVEQKNLLSQFHTRMALGKNKAIALQQMMLALFGLKIEAVPHRLTEQNCDQLLEGAKVAIDCLDNAASRLILQKFGREASIPCLHGALAADGLFAQVVWDEFFRLDEEDVPGQATCDTGDYLPLIVRTAACVVKSLGQSSLFSIYRTRTIGLWPHG